jgi:aryl-alcohol dehydrogenase (NADP+)
MYAWQFSKALYLADRHGWTRFVSMQDHYNLLNREEEREMHPLLRGPGSGGDPLESPRPGRLTRQWATSTERTETDELGKNLYVDAESDRQIVERVGEVAQERGVSMAQVAPSLPCTWS